MRRKICLTLVCIIILSLAAPSALAVNDDKVAVYCDGEALDFKCEAFILNGSTYVPLRDMSNILGAEEISWDGLTSTATVVAPDLEISMQINSFYMIANGRYLYMPDGCLLIDGYTMVPLRTLCKAFGVELQWLNSSAVVTTAGASPITSGDEFYDEDDVYWLSRIINAEAKSEPFLGKVAVGNVIMNRIDSKQFPNSVYNVIFDRKYGVQFTPAYSGAIYRSPNADSVIAAKLALDGANTADDSLYFIADSAAAGSWAGKNRPFNMQIGNHCFYA